MTDLSRDSTVTPSATDSGVINLVDRFPELWGGVAGKALLPAGLARLRTMPRDDARLFLASLLALWRPYAAGLENTLQAQMAAATRAAKKGPASRRGQVGDEQVGVHLERGLALELARHRVYIARAEALLRELAGGSRRRGK